MHNKDVRSFSLSNFQDGMLIIDCIDSTTYTFCTNPVYVSRTSNQLETISLFSRSFLGKPRKVIRKQTRRSSMILGFSS